MKIEIINIGTELLIGQVINTNAAWMGEQLNLAGFMANRILVIPDDKEDILQSLHESFDRSDIILVTGGLGPTRDDITKDALCTFFGTQLTFNEEAYRSIESFFEVRGMKVTELNRKQAEIPAHCTPIPNRNGTAPGMWFDKRRQDKSNVIFVSLPGVPFEMKAMVTDWLIPRLKQLFPRNVIFHKTVMIQGIGESFLADLIKEWEDRLPESFSLAYLPQPGIVRLRLTSSGPDEQKLKDRTEEEIRKLEKIVPEYIYGYDEERLEEIVGMELRERHFTLSTAESCTGGYVAHLITTIPGSSDYFKGSVVAYANEIKESQLGIPHRMIGTHGAVSEEVARKMAESVRERFHTDFSVATSGIAGPGGGTPEKPAGTTWIAVSGPQGTVAQHFLFGDNRERNIRRTALTALNLLRKKIIG
jgi:nicotinamide-nucleotide amidase